jgi:hypothetical protein
MLSFCLLFDLIVTGEKTALNDVYHTYISHNPLDKLPVDYPPYNALVCVLSLAYRPMYTVLTTCRKQLARCITLTSIGCHGCVSFCIGLVLNAFGHTVGNRIAIVIQSL